MTSPIPDELISAYLDGELTADQQTRVEQALRDDAELRRMCDELQALRFTLQSMPRSEPSIDLTEAVLRRAERRLLSTSSRASTSPALAATAGGRARAVAGRWRDWRIVGGTLATLATLVLLALWLPLQNARRIARTDLTRAPSATVEHRSAQPEDRWYGNAPMRESDELPLSEDAGAAAPGMKSAADTGAQPEPIEALGRGEVAAETEVDSAHPAEKTPATLSKAAAIPKVGAAGEASRTPKEAGGFGGGGFGMGGRAAGPAASREARTRQSEVEKGKGAAPELYYQSVARQAVPVQTLIDRLDRDRFLLVEVSLPGGNAEDEDKSSLALAAVQRLLEPEPKAVEENAVRMRTAPVKPTRERLKASRRSLDEVRQMPAFGAANEPRGGQDVLYMEGTSDQIRATLTAISKQPNVSISFAQGTAGGMPVAGQGQRGAAGPSAAKAEVGQSMPAATGDADKDALRRKKLVPPDETAQFSKPQPVPLAGAKLPVNPKNKADLADGVPSRAGSPSGNKRDAGTPETPPAAQKGPAPPASSYRRDSDRGQAAARPFGQISPQQVVHILFRLKSNATMAEPAVPAKDK